MRYVLFLLLVPAAALLMVAEGCIRLENPQRYFAKHEEAVYAGGWVPRVLPTAATEIHEQHDIDTNEVWVRFQAPKGALDAKTIGFSQVQRDQWPKDARTPPRADWWFGNLSHKSLESAALFVGFCDRRSRGYLLAAGSTFYLWCEGASAA